MEFGATVAVDFLVVVAEVHAIGGIRYTQLPDKTVDLAGYIRIGGSVELLGLVSVSVELLVVLHYEQATNEMVGRATLVVDIDLTLYSHKVELDSGRWAISGGALLVAGPPLQAAGWRLRGWCDWRSRTTVRSGSSIERRSRHERDPVRCGAWRPYRC